MYRYVETISTAGVEKVVCRFYKSDKNWKMNTLSIGGGREITGIVAPPPLQIGLILQNRTYDDVYNKEVNCSKRQIQRDIFNSYDANKLNADIFGDQYCLLITECPLKKRVARLAIENTCSCVNFTSRG